MNTAQEILNLILKMMYYNEFKSSLTQDERDFIQRINISSLQYFRISSLYDRRMILTWMSSKIHKDVACYANDDGFHFSEIELYKTSTKRMKGLAKKLISEKNMEQLEEEIDELKKAFRLYSHDVEVYFK